MERALFDRIFEQCVIPIIKEQEENNSLIKSKNIDICKDETYRLYSSLINSYRSHVLNKEDNCLLDRHKVASCICGAFLKYSIFNKKKLIDNIIKYGKPVDGYFFYVNELVAFFAGIRYLSFFMITESDDYKYNEIILENFPVFPNVIKNKSDVLHTIIFNLGQIPVDKSVSDEYFDIYAYALIYYFIEAEFYKRFPKNDLKY